MSAATGGGELRVNLHQLLKTMIDKGSSSLEVLDFVMALQADAKKGGGTVIVTLGNHEAEFLVDPNNSKASEPLNRWPRQFQNYGHVIICL